MVRCNWFSGYALFKALLIIVIIACLSSVASTAQTQDTSKIAIRIINMERITVVKTDTGEFQYLNGNVILQQGTDTLYCDSALMNKTTRNFEGFGHVRIAQQGGTYGTSDYLRYNSAQKEAFMTGDVHMTDGKNNLDCQDLTYNLGTKIAVYDHGGLLSNDSTNVTSTTGEYNMQLKEAHFKHNVEINDIQYHITSEDVKYNTESKITVFYAHSIVTRDSGRSILETSNGWYDGKLGIAHFTGFSKIWYDGQYIEADSLLYYNRQTGYGLAIGHVISIDTGHHATLYCGRAEYFQKQRKMWASIKPVLVQANGKDTIYIRADTFYSAPMVRNSKPSTSIIKIAKDSIGTNPIHKTDSLLSGDTAKIIASTIDSVADLKKPQASLRFRVPLSKDDTGEVIAPIPAITGKLVKAEKKKAKKKAKKTDGAVMTLATSDTAAADTTAPLYFIGYHHVLIFSDSLQGKCDSICYTRADSLIRMMYNPIAWSHKSQITGDTILMQLDSASIRKMYVPNNALIVSQSGPEKAGLWDQVQGKTLTAHFDSSAIKQMIVKPDAESIYYSKDDAGAYIGVIQSTSIWMYVFFEDQKIRKIKLDKEPHIVETPMDKADLPNMKLSKFKWLDDQRPLNKEELFR